MQILVIRTSAMGDVALTVPVLASLRKQYPDVEIVLLTRAVFAPFFAPVAGLKMFCPDLRGRHRGFIGLFRLCLDIRRSFQIDQVVDLHDVLRSKIICAFFRLSGKPVSVIDKGRAEKRRLLRGRSKKQLKQVLERYAGTFARAGMPVSPDKGPFAWPAGQVPEKLREPEGTLRIGIAPYAKHMLKIWPENNMARLLEMITKRRPASYWFFGGSDEMARLKKLQSRVPGSTLLSGKLDLSEELACLAKLDFMITMDSSNMHMASLAGTKVVSIWGATDPLAGFGAWNQPDEFAVRIPVSELGCRPCTVFGKGACYRGDFACMVWLTPVKVFRRLVDMGLL